MDEATLELLSRYLDGDLPEDEVRLLDQRLATDDGLRDELESMTNLQSAVRSLAAREQPPQELETLIEPLRRGRPAPQGLRPAFRWLAAAATVVLGVGVAVQIVRHNPAPTLPDAAPAARPDTATSDDGYFQLKPLPTRSPGEGDELVSAADRLLATPLAVPEIGAARPMEVVGPLDAPQPGRAATAAAAGEIAEPELDSPPAVAQLPDTPSEEEERPSADSDASWAPVPPEGVAEQRQRGSEADTGAVARRSAAKLAEGASGSLDDHAAISARLVIRVGDELRLAAAVASSRLEIGTYRLRVSVLQNQVTACRVEDDRGARQAQEVCARVLGIVLDGIGDGEHRAELVVPSS